jgi:hypothetical protein
LYYSESKNSFWVSLLTQGAGEFGSLTLAHPFRWRFDERWR